MRLADYFDSAVARNPRSPAFVDGPVRLDYSDAQKCKAPFARKQSL